MQLTHENYHSAEANRKYMSHHQFRSWLECPAREWAIQHGLYEKPMSEELVIGKRVDIALLTPDKLEAYDNGEEAREWLFTKAGKPNAAHAITERCIARVKREKEVWRLLGGEHQVLLTFDIDGVPWRCAIDDLDLEGGTLTDLKTCRDFDAQWTVINGKNTKVPFYEAYGYWTQLSVYRHAVMQHGGKAVECFILAVTKHDPADLAAYLFANEDRMDRELEVILHLQPSILEWKAAHVIDSIPRCERCAWCVSTKTLDINNLTPAESLCWPEPENRFVSMSENNKQEE